MLVKTDKIYIDYLDYSVSSILNLNSAVDRLRFDLLLFSEEILCMSVPACVKMDATTELLMELTPFWKNGRIKLILDKKHSNNPWNYFNNRKRVLEKGFTEQDLIKHFEYTAYNSPHTNIFYNIFIKEVLQKQNDIYIGKVSDTDAVFRESVITQVNSKCSDICSKLPINAALHMGRTLNELNCIASNKNILFQRSAVEQRLITEFGAKQSEIYIINTILDKGFAYANGISSYAAPLSLITNRLTGRTLIPILKDSDYELYELIHNLNWISLYKLSEESVWLDFVDHLNRLLLLYQDGKRHKHMIYSPLRIEFSIITVTLVKKIYEAAMEALQQELFKNGVIALDVINLKNYSEKMLEDYLSNRDDYWSIIKEINELIPILKGVIRSIQRRYKESTVLLNERGYIINLSD